LISKEFFKKLLSLALKHALEEASILMWKRTKKTTFLDLVTS